MRSWLKDGLLLSHGEKWSIRRKMITPTFHFDILRDYLVIMNENVEILVNKFSGLANTGKEFKIDELIHLYTLDVISETAMGSKIDAQLNSENEYIKAVGQ